MARLVSCAMKHNSSAPVTRVVPGGAARRQRLEVHRDYWETEFSNLSALLPNPSLQDRDRGLGQGCTPFLSTFAATTHMCTGSE